MMAYFNADEVDALSLQDMIDCDIKTEIDSMLQFQNSEKLSSLDYCLQQINGCDVGTIQNNNNLEYVPMDEFCKVTWGSEAERLHQLVEVENTDPNLLVNPQTGMPIHHQQPSNVIDSDSTSSIQHVTMNSHPQSIIAVTTPQYISVINQGINSNSPVTTPLGLNTVNIGGQHHLHHTYAQSSLTQHQMDNGNLHMDSGISSPSQTNPVLLEQLQSPISMQSPRKLQCVTNTHVSNKTLSQGNSSKNCSMDSEERVFPKPAYSYSCLIAMALKNSKNGSLPVSEIYDFMTTNFPYFKTAPDGWKNSVRHNLSLNKCFEKVENPNSTGNTRKGCLWGLNPAKVEKMEEEIVKWRKKDPETVKNSMANPEDLELIESGRAGSPNTPQRRPSQSSDSSDVMADQAMLLLRRGEEVRVKPKTVAEILHGDMNDLDTSLTLDPVLTELASQSGLWDDDLTGDLKFDGPFSSSPLTISNSPLASQPSPLTVCLPNCDGMIQGSYVYATTPYHLDHSPASKHITIYTQTPTRPLSAQT